MVRILARRIQAKIPMARPNKPDIPPKRTKKGSIKYLPYCIQIWPKDVLLITVICQAFQLCGAREELSFGGIVLTSLKKKQTLNISFRASAIFKNFFSIWLTEKLLNLKLAMMSQPHKVSDLILLDIRIPSRHGFSVNVNSNLNHMYIPKCLIRLMFFFLSFNWKKDTPTKFLYPWSPHSLPVSSRGTQFLTGVGLYFQVDILCNDEILGKDHTLKFICVTRWRFKVWNNVVTWTV